ncbi:MAG: type III-A CRISPR-associated protein Cas10/Csm1 [Magnetococcales bacterium]|nr:type III-A CRISPR-associated protein Cas10/Csm1 [Magnetococcales bacterium]MBF0321543.1 type III-A CRISPR-associated protein Cas10/Csm1 [Magnetococcales bacterium]
MDEKSRNLLEASCRMALAGMVHDIGKFAERADIPAPERNGNVQIYCPAWHGRHTHVHAAYTGIAMDALEKNIPDIKKGTITPFTSWSDPIEEIKTGDSLINAAAMHHKPETPLQRILATADRLASGFERSDFAVYNEAEEENEGVGGKKVNHLRARLWPLLERIAVKDGEKEIRGAKQRYSLRAMAPATLFPVEEGKAGHVPADDDQARREYKDLWDQFIAGLEKIPGSHRSSLPLWLDHFDSLFLTFTHAIPSATAAKKPGGGFVSIPADVSLYDHSKATAALAVALWRHHAACGRVDETFSEAGWKNWDEHAEEEFLLIQGDFFGIQEFILANGGETTKMAAKLLRGRSFQVSLLTELAAIEVLNAFQLPVTSQIVNAAGKFTIVAPHLPDAETRLAQVRGKLDTWFLKQTFGQSTIGLASTKARRNDFKKKSFSALVQRLFEDLEKRKRQRFGLCDATPPAPVFNTAYPDKACAMDGKKPAETEINDKKTCHLCADQITIGESLVKSDRLLVTREKLNDQTLKVDYFGYRITFTGNEEESSGELLRAWDFAPPHDPDGQEPLWNGYARRAINGHVPKDAHGIIEFGDMAESGVTVDAEGKKRGVAALSTLKGDVDNLGEILREGLKDHYTFARMAALSRQLNAFFAIWLPWHCARKSPHAYTVFAGGDDFFLIGPWLDQIRLAKAMQVEFARYVANAGIHFSAGLTMTKPGLPIPAMAKLAEEALDEAKQYKKDKDQAEADKNAITCWGRTVDWVTFSAMLDAEKDLKELVEMLKDQHNVELSTAYLYGLLHLCDKAESAKIKPEDNIWRSWFVYRTWRFVIDKMRGAKDEDKGEECKKCKTIYKEKFVQGISKQIDNNKGDYKIALFTHLYQRRKA